MGKKNIFFIVSLLIVPLISGCIYINSTSSTAGSSSKTSETETIQVDDPQESDFTSPTVETDPIREQISNMKIEEKIGQMVMLYIDGYTLDDDCRRMTDVYYPGGFIILGQNVKNSSQLLKLVNSLKSANSKNTVPLFISVDVEGGRVDRMPEGLKRYPANNIIGQINNPSFSFKIGSTIAEEINAFGFNMDFAPVLDINSNPENPVIGDRSFGSQPGLVSELGVQTMKGIQSGNIIPVIKHFPGHGDTSEDSHVGLPRVDNDLERLMDFELVPFREAINNGADAVMIAHILLPKIDPENPASLSKTIITGVLRNQLNFDGVVITDDMVMGAIIKNYDLGDGAVRSIKAGSDIILICDGYDNEKTVINALKKAADDGTITEERIDESVYRILKLKAKYHLSDSLSKPVDVDAINSKIDSVLSSSIK